jgi:glycosyltransferase involved in cell wall biosynthesis
MGCGAVWLARLTGDMRISIVLPGFVGSPTGGLKVAYQYANSFAAKGHVVTLVHQVPDSSVFSPKSYAIYLVGKIYQLTRDAAYVPWFELDERIHATTLWRISDRGLPPADVTILTGWSTAERSSARATQAGIFVQLVYDYEFWRSDPKSRPAIERALSRGDVHHVATSVAVAEMLRGFGVTPVATIPSGLDPNEFGIDVDVSSRPMTLTFCLRPEPHKDAGTALATIELVLAARPQLSVECFGRWRGSELPPGIHLRGQLSAEELRAFYNRSRIFLFTSQYEGFGLPAAEAMACGAAVVSTRSGGVEDFLRDHETGLLAPVGDATALAAAVEELLADDELRRRLATSGVNEVASLTVEHASGRLESLLEDLVRNS